MGYVFEGAGPLRGRYAALDWAATPLGPESSWSPALCGATDLVLHTRFPATLLWGPDLVLIYNEAYIPLIGDKHPAALGAPAREVFPEVWDTIGPMLETILDGGAATWVEDAHLPLLRRGYVEECWFTFSYSPVRGADGAVEGVLDIAAETTQLVLDRRRLELLGRLADELAAVERVHEVRERALPLLRAAAADLPAVDVRLPGAEDDASDPRLPVVPPPELGQRDLVLQESPAGRVAWLPLDRSDQHLDPTVQERPVLVTLLSQRLAPDESYLGFLRLLAASLAQALDRVRVREADRRAAQTERESQGKVVRVLEHMPAAFFSLDDEFRFTYVNAQAEAFLAHRREDLVGRVLWDLFPAALGTAFEDVYRGAASSGESASFDAYYPEPLNAWFEIRVRPGPDGLGVYFLDISDRRGAQQVAERAAARSALLAEVATELAVTLDAEAAVTRLPQIVVPTLADWCIVTLVETDEHASWRERLHDTGSWHADPSRRDLTARFVASRGAALSGASSTAAVLRTGRPIVVDDVAAQAERAFEEDAAHDLFDQLAPAAAAVLPLLGRGRTLGLLSVFNGAGSGPFLAEDLATLGEVASQVGLALDNARLNAAQRDLATELQTSLLTELPDTDHLQIAARYVSAAQGAQIGGDWYDAFPTGDGATSLVIGDVAGHDRDAAVAMAQVRNLLRGVAHALVEPPGLVLSALDRAMTDLAVGALATAVLATVEQTADDLERGLRTLRWSNAGHPPPLLVHPHGHVEWLERPVDLLLGLATDAVRGDHVTPLGPGATVLLYTDGLVERRGEHLDIGMERLREAAARLCRPALGLDLEALCDALLSELAGDTEDDVALLALRAHPEDAPGPPEAGPQRRMR